MFLGGKLNMKKALITGATDGIGRETAKELAKRDYNLIIHGRDRKKAEEVLAELNKINNNRNYDIEIADLESQLKTYQMAERVNSSHKKVDILINNAGTYQQNFKYSQDQIEKTLAVNYHSHFILTLLLLKNIQNSNDPRIINVSSISHSSKIDPDNIWNPNNYDAMKAYKDSKTAMNLFTFKLARLFQNQIAVNCLDPGVIDTKVLRRGWSLNGSSVEKGAITPVYLADSEKVKGETGNYYINKRKSKPASITYDKDLQDQLWNKSIEMIKHQEIKSAIKRIINL